MKILHVADYLPDLHRFAGGAEFAVRRIIEEQRAAGLDVDVATLRSDFPPRGVPWQRHYEMRNLDAFAPRLAYAVKQLFLPADPLAASDLARAIASSRPDIVHYHNLHFAGLSVIGEARAAGIPSVWSIYDYWIFCPSFMLLTNRNELCTRGHSHRCVDCIGTRRLRALQPLKRVLFHARKPVFERPTLAVDRFVVLSEASKDVLVRHGIAAERVCVVPQHIWKEAALARREPEFEPGRLVYVGWVEQRKGLHVIIRALGELAAEFPGLYLEVLGLPANAQYQLETERLARDQGARERGHFPGQVGRAELLGELQRAFLVTIPEQWENMSPVILTESMAAGACVLAARVGGIRQIVEEFRSGLLAERDDPSDFARKIRWAMANPERIRALGDAARARAMSFFGSDEVNRKMIALYRSLIATPR